MCPCPGLAAMQKDNIDQTTLCKRGGRYMSAGFPPLSAAIKKQYCKDATALFYPPKSPNVITYNTYAECYNKVISKAG